MNSVLGAAVRGLGLSFAWWLGSFGGLLAWDSQPEPIAPEVRVERMYYVDPETGDDARDGLSPATAWRTLAHANATLVPGHGVTLRAGEYIDERIEPARSGEPGKPIVYRGEGVGRTVLRARRGRAVRNPVDGLVRLAGRDHIVVEDLELDGARFEMVPGDQVACLSVTGDDNVFRRLSMHDANGTGVWFVGNGASSGPRSTSRNLLEQCEIYYCCSLDWGDPPGTPEDRQSAVVHDNAGEDNVVRLCRIRHNGADGIQPRACGRGLVLEWNDLHGNNEDGIDLKSPANVVVRYNLIHNNRKEGIVVHDLPAPTRAPERGAARVYGNYFVRQFHNALHIAGLTRGEAAENVFRFHDNVIVCSGPATLATVFLVRAPVLIENNLCVVENDLLLFQDFPEVFPVDGGRFRFAGNLVVVPVSGTTLVKGFYPPAAGVPGILGANAFALLADRPAILRLPGVVWLSPGALEESRAVPWIEVAAGQPDLGRSVFIPVVFRDPDRLDYRPVDEGPTAGFGPNWAEHLGWIGARELASINDPASPFQAGHYRWYRAQPKR